MVEPPKLQINYEGFVNVFLIDFWIYLTIKQVKIDCDFLVNPIPYHSLKGSN